MLVFDNFMDLFFCPQLYFFRSCNGENIERLLKTQGFYLSKIVKFLVHVLYCFSHESSRICFDEVKSYQMKVNYVLVIQLFIWESYFINPTHMCIYIHIFVDYMSASSSHQSHTLPIAPLFFAQTCSLTCKWSLNFFLAICRLIVHWIFCKFQTISSFLANVF